MDKDRIIKQHKGTDGRNPIRTLGGKNWNLLLVNIVLRTDIDWLQCSQMHLVGWSLDRWASIDQHRALEIGPAHGDRVVKSAPSALVVTFIHLWMFPPRYLMVTGPIIV